MPEETTDVTVEGGGTLYIFHAHTELGIEWIMDNITQEGYQPDYPNSIIVEHRYARDIAAGMQHAGLIVK